VGRWLAAGVVDAPSVQFTDRNAVAQRLCAARALRQAQRVTVPSPARRSEGGRVWHGGNVGVGKVDLRRRAGTVERVGADPPLTPMALFIEPPWAEEQQSVGEDFERGCDDIGHLERSVRSDELADIGHDTLEHVFEGGEPQGRDVHGPHCACCGACRKEAPRVPAGRGRRRGGSSHWSVDKGRTQQ
jgi:hypothetical protein